MQHLVFRWQNINTCFKSNLSFDNEYCNCGKFTYQNFQFKIIQPKKFVFEGDQQKLLWVNFFNNEISSPVKCEIQPDNGSDRYAAKCKHCLSSEHTLNTQQSSTGAYIASNKTQRINIWLLFLIAITDILT